MQWKHEEIPRSLSSFSDCGWLSPHLSSPCSVKENKLYNHGYKLNYLIEWYCLIFQGKNDWLRFNENKTIKYAKNKSFSKSFTCKY